MKSKRLVFLACLAVILGMFCACGESLSDTSSKQPGSNSPENYCTVSFEANGGTPAPQTQTIMKNRRVTEPPLMTKTDYGFAGWYKEAAFNNLWDFNYDYATQNTTLYAKWGQPVTVNQGTTLLEKLQWLASNAESYGTYILEVSSDESLAPQSLSYSGKSNITIQLIGIGGIKNIELNGSGSLFTISGGVTLVLDENIVLKGKANNNASLINVFGNLIMNNGSKISGNTASSYGGGVYVRRTFTMNGGEISGNTASSYGGGVYVNYIGTFNMNGGSITSNTASGLDGGGVYVDGDLFNDRGGTFTMTGGTISGNTASYYGGGVYVFSRTTFNMSGGTISGNTSQSQDGGGVSVLQGTFNMTGGTISGNTASYYGGGVSVFGGTFTMTDGTISGNTAPSGGGVYVSGSTAYRTTFNMTGGTISGNTASGALSSDGGGVSVFGGTFNMMGGTISSNTVSGSYSYGGGVYVNLSFGDGAFYKTGGVITGYSSDTVNGNVVKNSSGTVQNNSGHAVYAYVSNYTEKRKETTAGQGDNLRRFWREGTLYIGGAWDN